MHSLVAVIVDESKWLTASLAVALVAVVLLVRRGRATAVTGKSLMAAALNLLFGLTIGTMAFGHLLAVTTKLALGTLEGSLAAFYGIGVALALPSWWLVWHATRLPTYQSAAKPVLLNVWVVATLLALGLHNLPLAAQGLFNIGYATHVRPVVGRVLVAISVVVNAGLLIGSLVFLASGQSFEQFRGIE